MSKPKPRAQGVDDEAEERDRSLGHYFVPEKVVDIANSTVPEFDLDPCAHPSQLLKAKTKLVGSLMAEVDGYSVPWSGSVWLNPPSFKRLKKDVIANYAFYPLEDWFKKGLEAFEAGQVGTLMIYSPARNGVNWYNELMEKATIQFTFNQRVNCYIGQRNSDGEELPPREMTSPFGGSCLFLFSRDAEVVSRFVSSCFETVNGEKVPKGVLQTPLQLG